VDVDVGVAARWVGGLVMSVGCIERQDVWVRSCR
jgi:hypothetical protein